MNRFAYRVFYKVDSSSATGPLHSRKSEQEINETLVEFLHALPDYLLDPEVTVHGEPTKSDSHSIDVLVTTELDEIATNEAVKQCLDGLDLFSKKLGTA